MAINTILGSKLNMSHTFVDTKRVPLTWITAGPCVVTAIKNETRDGYWAIQLGFKTRKAKHTPKPLQGQLKATSKDNKFPKYLREVRLDGEPEVKVGDEVKLSDMFAVGDTVNVTAVSKGKGFAGVVKRWHFAGGPKTHGQSDRHRAPGSIGQGTDPGRVYKGKKMAGRMGHEQVTVRNLKVQAINEEENKLGVAGGVPGASGSLVIIKKQ